jgi:hypothetical protein
MDRKLWTPEVARCEGDGSLSRSPSSPRRRHGLIAIASRRPGTRQHEPVHAAFRVFLALGLVLLVAGCVASDTASDKNQQRGPYGGISIGGAVP